MKPSNVFKISAAALLSVAVFVACGPKDRERGGVTITPKPGDKTGVAQKGDPNAKAKPLTPNPVIIENTKNQSVDDKKNAGILLESITALRLDHQGAKRVVYVTLKDTPERAITLEGPNAKGLLVGKDDTLQIEFAPGGKSDSASGFTIEKVAANSKGKVPFMVKPVYSKFAVKLPTAPNDKADLNVATTAAGKAKSLFEDLKFAQDNKGRAHILVFVAQEQKTLISIKVDITKDSKVKSVLNLTGRVDKDVNSGTNLPLVQAATAVPLTDAILQPVTPIESMIQADVSNMKLGIVFSVADSRINIDVDISPVGAYKDSAITVAAPAEQPATTDGKATTPATTAPAPDKVVTIPSTVPAPAAVVAKPDPAAAVVAKPDPAAAVVAKPDPAAAVVAKPDPAAAVVAKPDPAAAVVAKPDPAAAVVAKPDPAAAVVAKPDPAAAVVAKPDPAAAKK